jgi:Flp pilus assembly protein TadB
MNPALSALLLIIGFGLLANWLIRGAQERAESDSERRLRALIREEMEGTQFSMPDEDAKLSRRERRRAKGSPALDRLTRLLEGNRLLAEGEGKTFIEWLDGELVVAGLRQKMSPYRALAVTLLIWFTGVVLPTFMVLAAGLPKWLYAFMVLFFLLYPQLKLRQLKTERQDTLRMELPSFIQQLRMMLSTRMTNIDDAIARVVRNAQLDPYDSELAREFGQAQLEYRLGGVDREEALRAIGDRTRVAAVQNLVDVIVQGMRTGTEMSSVLAEYGKLAQENWRQDMRTYMARKEPLVTVGVIITMFGGFVLFAAPLILNLAHSLNSV